MILNRFHVKGLAYASFLHRMPEFVMIYEQKLETEAASGAAVIDVRDGIPFGEGHFPGSLNVGLASSEFAPCVGFLVSEKSRIFLVVDRPEQGRRARVELVRVGLEKVGGFIEARRLTKLHRLTQLSVADLKSTLSRGGKPAILDVRSFDEWTSGRIPGSKNIPLSQLPSRASELSPRDPLVVVCQDGYQSAIASSWLQANGFDSIHNLLGGMDAYGATSLSECVAAPSLP